MQSVRRTPRWPSTNRDHPRRICTPSDVICYDCETDPRLQYTACDVVLLTQIYYYRWLNSRRSPTLIPESSVPGRLPSEATPLLAQESSAGTHEKKTSHVLEVLLRYGGALCFILGTGVAAWAIDEHFRAGEPRQAPEEIWDWKSQLLGWVSAILYSK